MLSFVICLGHVVPSQYTKETKIPAPCYELGGEEPTPTGHQVLMLSLWGEPPLLTSSPLYIKGSLSINLALRLLAASTSDLVIHASSGGYFTSRDSTASRSSSICKHGSKGSKDKFNSS